MGTQRWAPLYRIRVHPSRRRQRRRGEFSCIILLQVTRDGIRGRGASPLLAGWLLLCQDLSSLPSLCSNIVFQIIISSCVRLGMLYTNVLQPLYFSLLRFNNSILIGVNNWETCTWGLLLRLPFHKHLSSPSTCVALKQIHTQKQIFTQLLQHALCQGATTHNNSGPSGAAAAALPWGSHSVTFIQFLQSSFSLCAIPIGFSFHNMASNLFCKACYSIRLLHIRT